jgi:hypothetical protein
MSLYTMLIMRRRPICANFAHYSRARVLSPECRGLSSNKRGNRRGASNLRGLTRLTLTPTVAGNDHDRTADLRVSVSYRRASRAPTSHELFRQRNT